MSIQEQFEKFYENIQLTPSQKEDAKTKYTGICKKLHDHYYPNVEYDGSSKLLIGSHGKQTHIRPARDVDVIFIMPPEKFEQHDDNQSNGQSQLLQDVKKVLEEKYPDTPIRAFGKVVVVEFSDTKHNVELLPAWENADGTFIIPNSENGGSWEQWDPRSEIQKIQDSDSRTGRTKALIRMIKKWSENCTAELKSYQIENKVLDFFANDEFSDKEYSILVRDFFDYFYKTTNDEGLQNHLSTVLNRATKACDFEKETKLEKAVEEWIKIFKDDFPATLEKSTTTTTSVIDRNTNFEKSYPSVKEEFLDLTYDIAFAINPVHQVRIDARVTQDGFRPDWLSSFLQKRFPLKKKKKLIFSIIKNNVPSPYSIMWKVRNFGDEAKNANDLRGEITHDKGFATKEENTKYFGEHYVECYIIKNNLCVAMDKIIVPIDKN
ncbi:MAG: hypothetical protein HYW15_03020 [Candidatus Giovannonibacteria bacterium]|nr:MAG: hypothetical protein HYW15_03020 [Candidatus Giovannonibacteria bacterium]